MKKVLLLVLIYATVITAHAQFLNPVHWTYAAKKIDAKTYEVHITALIDGNWHIYSQDAGHGPVPTSFKFTANPLLLLSGKVKEIGNLEKSYDPNFKSELRYYEKQVDFVQIVKVKFAAATVMKGTFTFMVCNDRQCLPPKDIPFSINIGGK
jgi:hypothetical protein